VNPRDAVISRFLATTAWGGATIAPLAGDASNRRYLRLHAADGATAVVMDAPPEKGEDTTPFVTIARHLYSLGLSAPRILAADNVAGVLLLEDLGDDLFARVAAQRPELETDCYRAAVDVLVDLHATPAAPEIAPYDAAVAGPLAALAVTWYRARLTDTRAPKLEDELAALMGDLQTRFAPECSVLILRDYHAENLLWLPKRSGTARVGLLDFQDAMAGHPAYDLVSLLQDARRDVSPDLAQDMTKHYLQRTGLNAAAFGKACAVLGAQRSLRILGVFARLCLRDGKAHYVDLIPRVWAALQVNLAHPDLAPLSQFVTTHLPTPTPDRLQRLKTQCHTHPTPP